mgnify:CR=1 FL=1
MANEALKTFINFGLLACDKFYDGTVFHRGLADFMIQGGDPTGTGRGGPGYRFEDEFKGNPHKHDLISFSNAFHGRTMATISATDQAKMIDGFAPLLPGFTVVQFNDPDAALAALAAQPAGFLGQPLPGEGGAERGRHTCGAWTLVFLSDLVADKAHGVGGQAELCEKGRLGLRRRLAAADRR